MQLPHPLNRKQNDALAVSACAETSTATFTDRKALVDRSSDAEALADISAEKRDLTFC